MSTGSQRRWREGLAPLRGRQFRYQFAARGISMTGSTLSPVALSMGSLAAGLSVVDLGFVLAAYTVPLLAFVIVGGVVADRLPRHRVMLTADAVRALSQTAVGVLLLSGHPLVWALAGLQIVTGTATAFYQPASSGLTAHTVERARLQQANALLSLTKSLSGSVGPLCAAVLVVTAGAGWALVIDGLTFAGSATLLSRIRVPPPAERSRTEGFVAQLTQGFREVRSRSWVWSSILAFGACNLAASALLVLGPERLLHRHDAGVFGWAGIIAAMSVGEIAGNLAALRIAPRRPMLTARLVEIAQVPLIVSVALGAPMAAMIAAGIVCGIGMALPDAIWFASLQGNLSSDVISRVSSYDWLGSLALRPVGLAGGAAIGAAIGIPTTLGAAGALILTTCVLGALSPGIRGLRAPTPLVPLEEPTVVPAS